MINAPVPTIHFSRYELSAQILLPLRELQDHAGGQLSESGPQANLRHVTNLDLYHVKNDVAKVQEYAGAYLDVVAIITIERRPDRCSLTHRSKLFAQQILISLQRKSLTSVVTVHPVACTGLIRLNFNHWPGRAHQLASSVFHLSRSAESSGNKVNVTLLQTRERDCKDSAKVMQVFLQSRCQRKLAEFDVQSITFWRAAHRTNGILGRIWERRQPEHRPILFVDRILGAHDTVADSNADPEPVLVGRRRHHAPVRLPIGKDGAEHKLPIRKFSPYLDPSFFVDADHQSGLIVHIFKVSVDPHLRRKALIDLFREKVSVIVNETVACDAPEIGIAGSGHMQSVSDNARFRGRICPDAPGEASPRCFRIL